MRLKNFCGQQRDLLGQKNGDWVIYSGMSERRTSCGQTEWESPCKGLEKVLTQRKSSSLGLQKLIYCPGTSTLTPEKKGLINSIPAFSSLLQQIHLGFQALNSKWKSLACY